MLPPLRATPPPAERNRHADDENKKRRNEISKSATVSNALELRLPAALRKHGNDVVAFGQWPGVANRYALETWLFGPCRFQLHVVFAAAHHVKNLGLAVRPVALP